MAPETYYFFFSIIFELGALFFFVNLVLLRLKGVTAYGQVFRQGTAEYKRVIKLASNRNITITVFVTLLLAANLIYDVRRILGLGKPDYAHAILIYAPVATVLFSILTYFVVRKRIGKYL